MIAEGSKIKEKGKGVVDDGQIAAPVPTSNTQPHTKDRWHHDGASGCNLAAGKSRAPEVVTQCLNDHRHQHGLVTHANAIVHGLHKPQPKTGRASQTLSLRCPHSPLAGCQQNALPGRRSQTSP